MNGPSDRELLDRIDEAFKELLDDLHAVPYRGDNANQLSMAQFCTRVERQLSIRSWRGPSLMQRIKKMVTQKRKDYDSP